MTAKIVWFMQLVSVVFVQSSVDPSRLVGRWDSNDRSRGGLGVSLVLHEAAKCSKITGAMLDGRWTLSGTALTRTVPTGQGGSETQKMSVSIQGNTMVQIIDGERRTLKRVGGRAAGSQSINGIWSYPHDAGGVAYEDYESDGRFLFRLPITTEACAWKADRNHLRLTVGDVTTDFEFTVLDTNRLELVHDGEHQAFHRESAILPSTAKF